MTHSSKFAHLLLAILLVLFSQAQAETDSQDWTDLVKEISSTLELAKKNIWNEI